MDIRTKSAAVRRRALFSTTSLIVLGVILAGTPSRAAGTDWNGTTSTDWYTAGNWSAGVPTSATDANIDTISPNAAVVDAVGAQSYWLGVGRTGIGTLTIQNGGTVASNALGVSGVIGVDFGSVGTVTVTGIGSTWTNTSDFMVGGSGTGSLVMRDGGQVRDISGQIAELANSIGIVTVDGPLSTWTNSGNLIVGNSGTGTLNIQNFGTVNYAGMASIGRNFGSTGTVTVDGRYSRLGNVISGALYVGDSGTGTLTIQNSGTVLSAEGIIGNNTTPFRGIGTVTVDGAGSTWTNSGDLTVGRAGTGTLNIQNGGTVTNGFGYIGRNANSTGTVTVDGPNSTWTNSQSLIVGDSGTGTLNILSGGKVTNFVGTIGFNDNSTGKVTVDGVGSIWANSGYLVVGDYGTGTGTLIIQNGGKVSNSLQAFVGGANIGSRGIGTVTVDGHNSTWTNSSDLNVGNYGKGELIIQNGGLVSNTDGTIGNQTGSTGKVTVTGPSSTWTNSGVLAVGRSGTGELNISSGGNVTNANGYMTIGQNAGPTGRGVGAVTVDGQGSSLAVSSGPTYSGVLIVGDSGTGTLTLRNGGTISDTGGTIGYAYGSTGTVTVDGAGSTWTNTSLTVGVFGTGMLTIRNGGIVSAPNPVTVADRANSIGALNIGAAVGEAPAAPGTLNAPSVTFGGPLGNGNGTIVFNHTASNYVFAPVVSGPGQVLVEGGTTVLTGTNTYTGDTTISGGVLSVSSDSNLGAAASRVILDGGTLQATASFSTARAITTSSTTSGIDVAGANNLTLAGLVSGSGALTKSGTGMLTLTGANTYGGVTTISAGTLAIASTGGVTSDVNNNAALANAGTVAGSVANNAGATFTQTGGSVSGGVINAGTVIANGGALNGAIANNAGGSFNVGGTVAGNSTFTNANGATFAVAGGGNYALAGLLTNNGGATVAAGGALTANGGIFNAATGVITNNGTVTDDLNNAGVIINNATYNATVASNTGTIVNSAGATWNGNFSTAGIVGNAGTINGSLTQIAGTTTNNGAITSAVTVSGGLLTGAGSSGALTVANGATFQPGSGAAGTSATVSGMLAFQPGSTYAVNVNSVTASFAKVNGAATISGGTVQVLNAPGAYTMGTHYTIVTATSGRSGAFDGMTLANPASTPFLSFGLNYDPNNVYLDVSRSTVTFASVGQTPNQAATGGGLDSLPLTNPLIGALAQFDTTSARASYDRLSGEVHASAKAALIEDSRFVRDAMNDRLRSAFDGFGAVSAPVMSYASGDPEYGPANTERFAVWGRAFGSWGNTDDDGNAARLSRSTGGFFVGTDTLVFDTWRFGMLAGYSHTNFNVRDRNSSGTSDNYHVGLYGGTEWGSLAFRTGAAYTWHDISTSRIVAFPGFSDSLKGKYNAGIAQAFGELAYGMRAGTIGFEPFANLAYVNLHTDGFSEAGGAAALTSNGGSTDATFTTLGLRASTIFMLGDVNATARGMFGIRHAFGDVTPLATMAFAGGAPFTIAGVPIAKNTAVAEASLDFAITPNTTLGISYSGQFGTRTTDQSVRGNLDVKF